MKRDLKAPAESKDRKRDKDNPKQQYRDARKAKGQRLAYERTVSDKD